MHSFAGTRGAGVSSAIVLLAAALTACGGGGSRSGPSPILSAPVLVSPSTFASGIAPTTPLLWEDPRPLPTAPVRYDLEVATDEAMTQVVLAKTGIEGTSYVPQSLSPSTTYFWRVRAHAGGVTSPFSLPRRMDIATAASVPAREVVYQLVVRHFGNTTGRNVVNGDLGENGCGTFDDVDAAAIGRLADMGVTHIWLTGVLQQATLTDYTTLGEPADDPDLVKGKAGSFYAIKDYYDVCPDYATDKTRRLEELEALLDRIHAAGLKAIIDFVPNHVARSYASNKRPAGEPELGEGDDQAAFFAKDNAFFYLQADPGRALSLTPPGTWLLPGMDGRFAREDGTAGKTVRVTGNNDTSYAPAATSWYETVKLNYGLDFTNGATRFGDAQSRPRTWLRMERILKHWIDVGVDGFRCDFAHYVPDAAWSHLIAASRAHAAAQGREVVFYAEAYDNLRGLLGAGFDAVYDDGTYDKLKAIYQGKGTAGDLDAHLLSFTDGERAGWLRYLENHDERRIASPVVTSGGTDDSGFGTMWAGRHLAPVAYLAGNGPVLIYNGQEVGESGAGAEGFGGNDGRTTIFDYWRLPALSAWVNDLRFDGGGLTVEQAELRSYYRRMLAVASHPYVRGDRFYGLRAANPWSQDAAVFARFSTNGGGLVLVVANFRMTTLDEMVKLPSALGSAANAGLASTLSVVRLLDPEGRDGRLREETTRAVLEQQGFRVVVPPGMSAVYVIR